MPYLEDDVPDDEPDAIDDDELYASSDEEPPRLRAKSLLPRVTGVHTAGKTRAQIRAIQRARDARRRVTANAYYEKHRLEIIAKKRAAEEAATPEQKAARAKRAYLINHAGATPRHQMQLAAAQRHGIPVNAPPAMQIYEDNVMGAVGQAYIVRPNVPLAEDPNEPCSFANMVALITREKSKDDEVTSRSNYIDDMRLNLQYLTGMRKADVVQMDDMQPFFVDVDATLAKLRAMKLTQKSSRGAKGDPVAPYTVSKRLMAWNFVATRWTALKLTQTQRDKYVRAYKGAVADAGEELDAREEAPPVAFDDIFNAVKAKFGSKSMPFIYVLLFMFCPARDDFGSLLIVDKREQAIGPRRNFLIRSDDENEGEMTVLLRYYKTRARYGARDFVIPEKVADEIREWIADGRKYVFTKKGNLNEPYAPIPTEEEERKNRKPKGMSAEVAKFLRAALPRKFHTSFKGAAITALRRSWATSTKMERPAAALKMMHSLATHNKRYFSENTRDMDEATDSDTDDDEPAPAPPPAPRAQAQPRERARQRQPPPSRHEPDEDDEDEDYEEASPSRFRRHGQRPRAPPPRDEDNEDEEEAAPARPRSRPPPRERAAPPPRRARAPPRARAPQPVPPPPTAPRVTRARAAQPVPPVVQGRAPSTRVRRAPTRL